MQRARAELLFARETIDATNDVLAAAGLSMETPRRPPSMEINTVALKLPASSSSCVCLSDLETSRGEPGSRVLVQADNSFSARRRPVLWADIQDVVHCLLWGTTFADRGVLEAPLQHGRAEPAYTRAKAVEGCPLLSRQVEARDAVWIADEVVQSRRRSCQPIVFPAGPEPGLLRHAWGRQIAEMMGLLGEGAT